MRTAILGLALWGAGSCCGGVLLTAQSDSCLGSTCTGQKSGTLHSGADFNTFTEGAVASFGILHVFASSTFSVNNSLALALGIVSFTDDLTITSPTHANGTPGQLTLGYHIDGTTSTTGGGNAFLQVIARDYNITDPSSPVLVTNYVKDYNSSTDGSFVIPVTFPFTYGVPFELYLSMQATAGSITDTGTGYSLAHRTASGSGAVDFMNTLVVNELLPGDGSGNPVTDGSIAGASNTSYNLNGVVPEPGTLALVGLALPALLWWRKRR